MYRLTLLLGLALTGCSLAPRVDRIDRWTERLGVAPTDTRAVHIATDGSIAFEVLGRTDDRSREPRVRYVVFDAATVERAIADADRRSAHVPATRPVLIPGIAIGPPARVIPSSPDGPDATPADLPPTFRDARRIAWSGNELRSMAPQPSAITAQPVTLRGREFLLVAGSFGTRHAHTAGGSVAYSALIGPAVIIDSAGKALQWGAFIVSAPAW